MSDLRLLIVDDEPLIRAGLRENLSAISGIEVIGECGSGEDAVESILAQSPDLVLLDIQMPGCSGLEVVRRVGPARMPAVIFVTAYEEYAIKAFEMNAVDYLLKPFDEDRLKSSIARTRERIAAREQSLLASQLQNLLESHGRRWPERLVVRNGERYEFVSLDSVDWIDSANNYVELHCGPRTHLLGEALSSLEKRLNPDKFLRVHRCHLVNISRIVAVYPVVNGTYEIELRSGDTESIPAGNFERRFSNW